MTSNQQRVADIQNEEIFTCRDESNFYSMCIEHLLLSQVTDDATLIEFGSGDGTPVIDALKKSDFTGQITGFELNAAAHATCQKNIAAGKLSSHYRVLGGSFFEKKTRDYDALLANPPYIPFPDNSIRLPYLHGGPQGSELSMRLLTEPCRMMMMILSSYSNPVGIIDHARQQGLCVADFFVTPISYGIYSREPKVFDYIMTLKNQGCAYASENGYLLAGVLFVRADQGCDDHSDHLKNLMRSTGVTTTA